MIFCRENTAHAQLKQLPVGMLLDDMQPGVEPAASRKSSCALRPWLHATLRFDCDCDSTALRPRYNQSTTCVTTAMLRCGLN